MTTEITAAELDALVALLAKATPGPWRESAMDVVHGPEQYPNEQKVARLCSTTGDANSEAHNAKTIASLYNAAPALIAAARREQKMRVLLQEWLTTEMDSMDEEYAPWIESFTRRIRVALEGTL